MTVRITDRTAAAARPAPPHQPKRESDAGVIAVYDPRSYGGTERPWVVRHVPPGHIGHYPTQCLSAEAVAAWARLVRVEVS